MAKFFDLKVQSAKEILRFEKKGTSFFVLLSTFRNFVRNLKLSVAIGSLRDKALLRVTNWKPTDFRILPQFA
jgi:hypothetical protein